MPSPATHIYHAKVYLQDRHRDNIGAFMRGTVFPDIRYLAGIDRSRTHRKDVGLDEISAESDDWSAGRLLHCWVDQAWAEYFAQYNVDAESHAFDSKRTALKLVEDGQIHIILRSFDFHETAEFMEQGNETGGLAVSPIVVRQWYGIVADLLRDHDSKTARDRLLQATRLSQATIDNLEARASRLRASNVWPERVRDCRRILGQLLSPQRDF